MRFNVVGTVLALALAIPSLASAQDWEAQVRGYLSREISDEFQGWSRPFSMETDYLNQGQSITYEYTLTGGTEYLVIAGCDADCSDIDLFVRNPIGRLIIDDDSASDFPWGRFTADRSGTFRITVTMYDCDADYCYFALQVMN